MQRKTRPTENQIAQQIVDYLRLRGWRVHRLEADLRGPKARVKREEPGTPDYIAVRTATGVASFVRGYDVVYIEVKRPGAKLRRSQEIWISQARDEGWDVVVATGVEDLIKSGYGL
jgi:alpha-amylase/alpha-mannosidase (GH57 family)